MRSVRLRVVDYGHGSYVFCDDLPSGCAGMVCHLGGVRAVSADGIELGLPPKAFKLLGFLASAVGRDVSLPEIIAHLWPVNPPDSVRANLRSYVSRIRALFGHAAVVRGHECLRLEPAVVPSDVYLLQLALDHVPQDLDQLESLLRCIKLALDTHSAGRAVEARPTGQIDWLALTGRFVGACFNQLPASDRGILLPVLSTLRHLDPMNEGLCALHIRILYGLGDRGGALATFAEHRLSLSMELGISPSDELQVLHQQLLSSHLGPSEPRNSKVFELPTAPEVFLGRSTELDRATAMLTLNQRAGNVLLIHGRPGVGKTAFAVALGNRLADTFIDGVVYVKMHANSGGKYDRGSLLRVIIRSLGVTLADLPDDVDRLQATYRSLLHSLALLVILDDVPRGFDLSGLVSAGSRSALCITAREPNLHIPPRRHLQLSMVPLNVAADILLENAGLPPDECGREIALSIATSCGGLPLASKIIGGQLATNSFLTLADVQRRIRHPKTLLDSLEYGSLSVRRVIQSSLDSLDDHSVLLLRLVVFARLPWVDSGMLEAALSSDLDSSGANVEMLVTLRLLDVRGTDRASRRYRIHDLVREVLKEALSTTSPAMPVLETATLRILEWFQTCAQRQHFQLMGSSHFNVIDMEDTLEPARHYGQEHNALSPASWIETYDEVIANLIEVAAQGSWPEQAWMLAVTCAPLFELAHLASTWRRTHLAALAGARRQGNSLGEGAVLLELAELDLMPDSLSQAERWLDQAVPPFLVTQNRKGLGVIEEKRGRICFMKGRFRDARRHLESAVTHFDSPHDKASAALAKRYLGQSHAAEGDMRSAEACYAEALQLAVDASARRVEGQIYIHMASLAISLGQLDRARGYCRVANEIFNALGGLVGVAYVVLTEAQLLAELGDTESALANAARAEELAYKSGDHALLRSVRALQQKLATC